MRSFLQDVRFGLRMLRRNTAFSTAAALILGLGIGANTVILSIANALIFRPLPYRDAERLVFMMAGREPLKTWGPLSYPEYLDLKEQSELAENMAALAPDSLNLTGTEEPERLRSLRATADVAPLLGLPFEIGRSFDEADCAAGAGAAVILSHGLWQRRFGSRLDILGQTLILNGVSHIVVGVLGPEARMAYIVGFEPDLWTSLVPPKQTQRNFRDVLVIARLKPGVTIEQAEGESAVIARRLQRQYPDSNAGWSILVSEVRPRVDRVAYIMLALLVTSVLGLASSNVANLVLARSSGRAREMAIREALGAGRTRIVRQILTESLLLASCGCCLGVLIAVGSCNFISAAARGSNLEIVDVRPDARVLAATLVLLVVSALVVGIAPLARHSGTLLQALKEGGIGSSGSMSRHRLGSLLAAFQIALSLVLLAAGGLALKSWFRLWHVDPGYRPENVLTARLSLTEARFSGSDRRIEFFRDLLARLKGRSDIRNAGVASALPTSGPQAAFTIPGRPRPAAGEEPLARCNTAGDGYFETMAIPLKAGRYFSAVDTMRSQKVAIVNDTLARKYWGGDNPLGIQIDVSGNRRTIIGVIGDLRDVPLAMKPQPEIYLPYSQNPVSEMMLAVKSERDPAALAATLKREIHALEPNQAVDRLQTMETIRARNMGVIRVGSRVLVVLGIGSLVLSAVGLYGVLSHSVARRRAEFGIRIALGARPQDVLAMILRQGLRLSLLGILPGLAAATLLTRILSRRLYGLTDLEPLIVCGIALLLIAVALIACLVPARRATRVDPMVALRSE